MPINHLRTICNLVNNQEHLEDEKAFKEASICVICKVIGDIDENEKKKYMQLFHDKLNITAKELDNLLQYKGDDIDAKVEYIKNAIGIENRYELMQFLRILNRFVMAHGCNKEDYIRFESIRDKFIDEFK